MYGCGCAGARPSDGVHAERRLRHEYAALDVSGIPVPLCFAGGKARRTTGDEMDMCCVPAFMSVGLWMNVVVDVICNRYV